MPEGTTDLGHGNPAIDSPRWDSVRSSRVGPWALFTLPVAGALIWIAVFAGVRWLWH